LTDRIKDIICPKCAATLELIVECEHEKQLKELVDELINQYEGFGPDIEMTLNRILTQIKKDKGIE